MTTKLHEILATEKTVVSSANKMLADTSAKFSKFEYFQGFDKTLHMLEDTPQSKVAEAAAAEVRQLPTTVHETLAYALKFWVDAEDVVYMKNTTNRFAIADLTYKGTIIAEDVSVDELMGLEVRLANLRKLFDQMPTLPASSVWLPDTNSGRKGSWVLANPETTIKTEKVTTAVVLYDATDKHPAQIKEVSTDKTVGTFKLIKTCGAATSAQKAEVLSIVDELLVSVKQARMRANSVEVQRVTIGKSLIDIILKPFN